MISSSIHYEQSEIHYLYFRKGAVTIFCLHGFGEDATSFNPLTEYLPPEFSLIAIDLPFHGATEWNEKRAFTIADLQLILDVIFNTQFIQKQPFILMGYSMGGRIALNLFQHLPERISKLILLAPDGMKMNFWYWLATQTNVGNRIFRFTMNKPSWFLGLLKISNRFKLINKSVFKYVNTYLDDHNARAQLFNCWSCMRTFKPDLEKIRATIQHQQLPVRMLYGKYDRMILSKKADEFREGLGTLCRLQIIDAGHRILQRKYALMITELLIT